MIHKVKSPYQRIDQLDWSQEELENGKLIKIRGFPKDKKVEIACTSGSSYCSVTQAVSDIKSIKSVVANKGTVTSSLSSTNVTLQFSGGNYDTVSNCGSYRYCSTIQTTCTDPSNSTCTKWYDPYCITWGIGSASTPGCSIGSQCCIKEQPPTCAEFTMGTMPCTELKCNDYENKF